LPQPLENIWRPRPAAQPTTVVAEQHGLEQREERLSAQRQQVHYRSAAGYTLVSTGMLVSLVSRQCRAPRRNKGPDPDGKMIRSATFRQPKGENNCRKNTRKSHQKALNE
jgi:hypothetical protein